MMGFGPTEFIIVAIILLVLFAPTLVAFFLGYALGKRRGADATGVSTAADGPSPAAIAVEPPVSPEDDSAPGPDDQAQETGAHE